MAFGAPSVFIYGTLTALIAFALLLVAPAVLARYEKRQNEVMGSLIDYKAKDSGNKR